MISRIGAASGTASGSAVRTPSTSVQISTSSAPSIEPRRVAVKSDAPRPSVVVSPFAVEAMNPVTTGIPASPGSRARTSFRDLCRSTRAPPKRVSVRSNSLASTSTAATPWERMHAATSIEERSSPKESIQSRVRRVHSPRSWTPLARRRRSSIAASRRKARPGASSAGARAWRSSRCISAISRVTDACPTSPRPASSATSTNRSVVPFTAETTTTGVELARASATRPTTRRIRAALPTDVPPNFITRIGDATGGRASGGANV